MIGCSTTCVDRVKAVASLMGTAKNIVHCGPPTSGLKAKIINNYLFAVHLLAASEAMNMGAHYGLDLEILNGLINSSSGRSHITENANPDPNLHPVSSPFHGYDGGFALELCRKDVGLAVAGAKEVGAKLVLGESTVNAYQAACEDERCRGKDCRVVYRWLGANV